MRRAVRADRFRFDPPRIVWTEALDWTLVAAFARQDIDATAPDGSVSLARRLGVAERIGARRAGAGEAFRRDLRNACALELRLIAGIEELLAVPFAVAVPPVLLKFAALHATGRTSAGARPSADIDVLSDARDGPNWIAALLASGFTATEEPTYEQHWPALRAPSGALIEIHRVLLGVRLDGRRSCSSADLAARGLTEEAPGYGPAVVPVAEVLLAHAMAHALAQHGDAPRAYPMLRLFCDAIDVGISEPDGEQGLERVKAWIRGAVSEREAVAVADLCGALVSGSSRLLPPTSDAARLLDHAVSGALDEGYREALKLRWLGPPLSDRPLRAWFGNWRRTVAPRDRSGVGGAAARWLELARRTGRAARHRWLP